MDYESRLAYVKKMHVGQTHAHNVSVSHHLERVSKRLEYFLNLYAEGSDVERKHIYLAALGHDVLEDTEATREEIVQIFSDREYEIILGMTNEWGDDDVTPYVKKIADSEEGVRLIKLSDLLDNITPVTYNIATLTPAWVDTFFLRVVTPMKESVLKTEFNQYPKTAAQLKEMVRSAYQVLLEERSRF